MESGVGQQRCVQGCVLRRKALDPMAKPGRNDRCPCGSGKKYKACCLPRDEAAERDRLAAGQAEREARAEAGAWSSARPAMRSWPASPVPGRPGRRPGGDGQRRPSLHRRRQAGRDRDRRPPSHRALSGYPGRMEFLGHVHENAAKTERPSPAVVACWRSSTARRTTSTRSHATVRRPDRQTRWAAGPLTPATRSRPSMARATSPSPTMINRPAPRPQTT